MTPSLAPILLQFVVTLGLLAVFAALTRRYRKAYLGWWTAAWFVFVIRLIAIARFVVNGETGWLWLHQTATGWTAIALLGAAWSFSHRHASRRTFVALFLVPPVWATIALLGREQFLLAAVATVIVLSGATAMTGWTFFRYHRATGSPVALAPAVTLFLWALHHLDYPLLRSWDAWNPWGYYLDTAFEIALGAGVLFLVLEDLESGVHTLGALALGVDGPTELDTRTRLLDRLLTLPGVNGSALLCKDSDAVLAATGAMASSLSPEIARTIRATCRDAVAAQDPVVVRRHGRALRHAPFAYVAALPLGERVPSTPDDQAGVLVVTGLAREPFAALDVGYLRALGQQVGAVLAKQGLLNALSTRSDQLASLSARMMKQHEDERRRLARELHDETAQVFSAVRLQVGLLGEVPPEDVPGTLSRALALIDEGIASIRSVTGRLRPPLLDDLGLDAALRVLCHDFAERSGIRVSLNVDADSSPLAGIRAEAELAVFRAVQEGLSNVSRHADAEHVRVDASAESNMLTVRVIDDGRGPIAAARPGGMGLVGMQERLHALGGNLTLRLRSDARPGTELSIRLPIHPVEVAT